MVPSVPAPRLSSGSPLHDEHRRGHGQRGSRPPARGRPHRRDVMRPAVFLDRDGTLIEERGYLDRLELISLYPDTPAALRLLQDAGYALVLVTNQAGVARGFFDEAFVQ